LPDQLRRRAVEDTLDQEPASRDWRTISVKSGAAAQRGVKLRPFRTERQQPGCLCAGTSGFDEVPVIFNRCEVALPPRIVLINGLS